MEIGIVTPCHVNDQAFLRKCKESIANLNPQPFCHIVNINKGEQSLKQIRTDLFDAAFEKGSDVVLQCSADFWLFPKILAHVRKEVVTSFANLNNRFLSDMMLTGLRLIYPRSWTGCYSLPKEVWEQQVKPAFDGNDTSVHLVLGKRNYVFVRSPLYYAMRPWRRETTKTLLANMSLKRKIHWKLTRLK